MATDIAGTQTKQTIDGMWAFPEAIPSRRDLIGANHVEVGIAIQDVHGTDLAAEYLKAQGIAIDVAIRVLSRPTQRRKVPV